MTNGNRMTIDKTGVGQDNCIDGTVYLYDPVPREGVYATVAGRGGQHKIIAFDLEDLDALASAARMARTLPEDADQMSRSRITSRGIPELQKMLITEGVGDDVDDEGAEDGDLVFYAEPETVGRFVVGMGDIHGGDGTPRIGICGESGSVFLTSTEAIAIRKVLNEMIVDTSQVQS